MTSPTGVALVGLSVVGGTSYSGVSRMAMCGYCTARNEQATGLHSSEYSSSGVLGEGGALLGSANVPPASRYSWWTSGCKACAMTYAAQQSRLISSPKRHWELNGLQWELVVLGHSKCEQLLKIWGGSYLCSDVVSVSSSRRSAVGANSA